MILGETPENVLAQTSEMPHSFFRGSVNLSNLSGGLGRSFAKDVPMSILDEKQFEPLIAIMQLALPRPQSKHLKSRVLKISSSRKA